MSHHEALQVVFVCLCRRSLALDRRTRHVAIGAEHAAITELGAHGRTAGRAVGHDDAGILGHGVGSSVAALWAGEDGYELNLHRTNPFYVTGIGNTHTSPY